MVHMNHKVRSLIYKYLYIGVPIYKSDFQKLNIANVNVNLMDMLGNELLRVKRDKISFYLKLKQKRKTINRKLLNLSVLFTASKRKRLLKRRKKISLAIKEEESEIMKTKNSFSSSKHDIRELEEERIDKRDRSLLPFFLI